jgi:hypothetical protein
MSNAVFVIVLKAWHLMWKLLDHPLSFAVPL